MPPSQLKRLKASLREQGIVGPQKSKKQKKKGLSTEQKVQRNVALESIRENFNPFEVKHLSRPSKHEITTPATLGGKTQKAALGRPGVTKSLGEQKRRKTLLLEVQNRNKVGGILDRRLGEDDEDLTTEDKALQRYTWEKSRKKKGTSVFDLEDDDGGEDLLTHGGRTIDREDYDAASVEGSSDDEESARKRRRDDDDQVAEEGVDSEVPERKKSKTEVMEEVIKKSKMHKYERQQAKEEDEDLRLALDKDFSDVQNALSAFKQAVERPKPVVKAPVVEDEVSAIHPARAALMNGSLPENVNKAYDDQLRKIAQDGRARVTDRMRTEEELVEQAAERAKEVESKRLKRMRGESDDEDSGSDVPKGMADSDDEGGIDHAEAFGFKSKVIHTRPEGIDDEDDFLIEEGLIASGSEPEDDAESADEAADSDDDLLAEDEALRDGKNSGKSSKSCPRTIEEVQATFKDVPYEQYHDVIRAIRIRTDPALLPTNKERLADFAEALVEFLAEMPELDPKPPAATIDAVIRHIHSMARKAPTPVSTAFFEHLRGMHEEKSMDAGDLVMLAAIGAIFPPSDHFHQIVTPAIILMARWLGLTTPQTAKDLATGAYLTALCLKYQSLSKRYVPEAVRFTLRALSTKVKDRKLLDPHIANVLSMASLWSDKPSFIEIFTPFLAPLTALNAISAISRLRIQLSQSALSRRTLELHHHRPLAIKTHVPKFEEGGYDPAKHYDPDAERAESTRLRKEYKKERKGAMRELRKDGNFLAREQLRDKKERDRAYDDKYRKLVAEIQGQEGGEKNAYERERRKRKGQY